MLPTINLFLLLCFYWGALHAQNLVPNPSFELSTNPTPCHSGNLNRALAWDRPTGSITTPDLFNTCQFFSTFGCNKSAPANMGGPSNPPHSGNAYAGAVDVYDLGVPNNREYLQTRLTSPLVAGQTYHIGFWILKPDSTKYSTDSKGLYLSASPPNQAGNQFINVSPQIVSGLVSNDQTWTLVDGYYTAMGGEEWLTIGNFSDDANTTIQPTGRAGGSCILIREASYYFFDDVFVEASTILPLFSFQAKKAKTQAALSWQLDLHHSYYQLQLERSSNGYDFTPLAILEAYERNYWDEQPLPGDNYYRLKLLQTNGYHHYSDTKALHFQSRSEAALIYPNPFKEVLYYNAPESTTPPQVALYSITGQALQVIPATELQANLWQLQMPSQLATGVYLVAITTQNQTIWKRVHHQ